MAQYSLLALTLTLCLACLGEPTFTLPSVLDNHCNKGTSCPHEGRSEGSHGTHVLQFPFMISPEDFYYSFVSKHKPVVLKGAASTWPAFRLWTDNHIMSSYGSDQTLVNVKKGVLYDQQSSDTQMAVAEFFSRYASEDLTIDDEVSAKTLLQDVTAPLCLRCEHMMSKVKVSYWLRNSNASFSSNLHLNTQETLLVALNGNIRVLLLSPMHAGKLYTDESKFLGITEMKVTQDNLDESKVPFQTAELREGDMLYIPQMWWQQTSVRPGRNLAIKFRWPACSLPLKSLKETQGLRDDDEDDLPSGGKLAKFGRMMMKYEQLLQTSEPLPLRCSAQDKRMSEYEFETTKMSPDDYKNIHDGPDYREDPSCSFDESNPKSPCHAEVCKEDPECPECIRYTLEYCLRWEDHGCIADMPQLLNKKHSSEMNFILAMESQYEPDN